jgi:ATP-dependent Clp endopeptidase proteolytic subunit ClpP
MFLLEKKGNKAILTVYGYVGEYYLTYENIMRAIKEITDEGYQNLDFHLHSYGGLVFDGNLIYNALVAFNGQIDMYIDGVAASMGSVIMMAGTRIFIAENAYIMIHAPSGGAYGNAKDLEKYAKLLRSIEKDFTKKLMERTGKTEEEVKQWLDGDNWFDADEAVSEGLADETFSPKVKDIAKLDKEEVVNLGAKGTFEKFAALTKPIDNPKIKQMDKKALIARYGLTDVTEQNSDEEVMAAIDKKMEAERTKAKKAEDDLKAQQKKAIENAVDNAVSAGKLKKEKRDEYITRGEKIGLDELNAIFADMQVYEPITGKIKGKDGKEEKPDASREDWDWDKWQKEDPDGLEALAKKDSKAFNALYKAKYKTNAPE